MRQDLLHFINNTIIRKASGLRYVVADHAPSTEIELFNTSYKDTGLVIWSGMSDNTIFNDPSVNWAFRALHDALHIKTRIGFTVDEEIYLGRIQASAFEGIVSELVYLEVAGQAEYYKSNGVFIKDQRDWTLKQLNQRGLL